METDFILTFKYVGEKVKAARELREISTRELAKLAGVSRTTICKIESGTPQPYNINNLLKVINKLGIHLRIP